VFWEIKSQTSVLISTWASKSNKDTLEELQALARQRVFAEQIVSFDDEGHGEQVLYYLVCTLFSGLFKLLPLMLRLNFRPCGS
jgi:hypothetical protein